MPRDPAWHRQQLFEAAERRRRELDPEGLRAARRLATRRCRAKQAATGLTFAELRERAAIRHDQAGPEVLAEVLREEVAAGRIEFHSTIRRYRWGGADPELRKALRLLDLDSRAVPRQPVLADEHWPR